MAHLLSQQGAMVVAAGTPGSRAGTPGWAVGHQPPLHLMVATAVHLQGPWCQGCAQWAAAAQASSSRCGQQHQHTGSPTLPMVGLPLQAMALRVGRGLRDLGGMGHHHLVGHLIIGGLPPLGMETTHMLPCSASPQGDKRMVW